MTIKPFFRWFDLWIGAYFDRQAKALYICPLPMIGVKISEDSFPSEIGLSMSPFMYSCRANRTQMNESSVTYVCRECPFQISVDPRDMTIENVKQLMFAHFNQSH